MNTNEGRFSLTTEGDLQIVQLHRTDSGTYVCVADNGVGEPVTREVSLTVTGKVFLFKNFQLLSWLWMFFFCMTNIFLWFLFFFFYLFILPNFSDLNI